MVGDRLDLESDCLEGVKGHFFASPRVKVRFGIFIDLGSSLGSRVHYSDHHDSGEG